MTKSAVNVLMEESKSVREIAQGKYNDATNMAEKEYHKGLEKARALKESAQHICKHDDTVKEEKEDYHRNTFYTWVYCQDCGKFLGKE